MEIRVLKYFLEAAKERSITRASEHLYISQPTISKQLKELEKELGAKLFTRSNYSIELTEAGMLLRERAEDILSLVDKTLAEFHALDDLNIGEIYVGAPEAASMKLFAETVRDLQKEHPGIRCRIYSGNMESVCERLDKGILDFAVVLGYVDPGKYNYLQLPTAESWGLVMKKDDPLAEKPSFMLLDLKGLPLICSEQWLDQDLSQWFNWQSNNVNVVATYNLAYNGCVMAATGMGYALILDKLIDTGPFGDLVFRPLSDGPKSEMFVIWRKNQKFSSASNFLLEELQKRFR